MFCFSLEQEAQLPLRNRATAIHFFVANLLSSFYHRNDLQLRLITLGAYVR